MVDEVKAVGQRYDEAVERLNSLQSNMAVLSRIAAAGEAKRRQPENMREMSLLLQRLEIKMSDLAKLKFIHVSGTKGKGSVCAFTESLLRHRSLKTGFYSSPHLVEVRERIRINGRPLSKEKFVEHFWIVYNKLDATKELYEGSMPPYFRFLTLMGLHVFLAEAVDVAVMEVGIGGRFDCTNIIPVPSVCGITPLGYDHIQVLGNTMTEIAWNKAGIMKPGCSLAVTWSGQPEEGMAVLREEAAKAECRLVFAPPLADYPLPGGDHPPPLLGIHGPGQDANASLALQLAQVFLRRTQDGAVRSPSDGAAFPLDAVHLRALAETRWPGRCSVVERSANQRFHLDGAHTVESLELCTEWFSSVAAAPGEGRRVLVFNVTGGREAGPLFQVLQHIPFDFVIFCPNLIHSTAANQPDPDTVSLLDDSKNLEKVVSTRNAQMRTCHSLMDAWGRLQPTPAAVLPSVEAVIAFLDGRGPDGLPAALSPSPGPRLDVLVTGSLHLVGDFYALLRPDLNTPT